MVFPKLRWSLGSQLLGSDILHVQIWSLWFNEAMRRGASTSNGNNSGKLRRQMLKQWSLQTLPEELELLLSQKIAGWWNLHGHGGKFWDWVFLGGTQKVRLQVFVQHWRLVVMRRYSTSISFITKRSSSMKLLILDFLVYTASNSQPVQQAIWGLCWKGMVFVLLKHFCCIQLCNY